MLKKFYAIIPLVLMLLNLGVSVSAQEIEAATTSNLTNISLPANAQRIAPGSVPAEVQQTFDKFIAASNGKLRQGDSEVLVWGGASYSKSSAPTIVNRITNTLKTAGWQYSVEGEESGVTVFTAFKDGAARRAVVGFYGATDEAFIFAWTELLSNGAGVGNQSVNNSQDEQSEAPARKSGGSAGLSALVGTWQTGNVSMMNEKNLYTGQITSSNGSLVMYKFFPDGRFEHIGYMKSTMYGCTTDLFNDKRGTVEINGNQITFIPTKNYWKNTYSCSPASNKERNYVLDRETYTFQMKTDEYGKQLICLTNDKGERCYRREK
jgi:hypothetical protein